jgi:hypothetical protein
MTDQQLQELREAIYQWTFFFLHDRDFIASLRVKYSKEDVDKAIADILTLIKTWMNSV